MEGEKLKIKATSQEKRRGNRRNRNDDPASTKLRGKICRFKLKEEKKEKKKQIMRVPDCSRKSDMNNTQVWTEKRTLILVFSSTSARA